MYISGRHKLAYCETYQSNVPCQKHARHNSSDNTHTHPSHRHTLVSALTHLPHSALNRQMMLKWRKSSPDDLFTCFPLFVFILLTQRTHLSSGFSSFQDLPISRNTGSNDEVAVQTEWHSNQPTQASTICTLLDPLVAVSRYLKLPHLSQEWDQKVTIYFMVVAV